MTLVLKVMNQVEKQWLVWQDFYHQIAIFHPMLTLYTCNVRCMPIVHSSFTPHGQNFKISKKDFSDVITSVLLCHDLSQSTPTLSFTNFPCSVSAFMHLPISGLFSFYTHLQGFSSVPKGF